VAPDEAVDPRFAQALRQAMQAGVEVYAYRCPLSLAGLSLGEALPVAGSLAAVDAYV
jgi:sugar fermentation stimulation protein A